MVAWSSLPVEIRHGIVKEMDLRTRFRFRHVSKTDQQIVDSVPLNLPRIVLNFDKNDDKTKLEFYLGINRKITVDFEKSEERVVNVKVSGESIDNPIQKLVKFENSALLAFTTFKNVAIHPKTFLNGLEINGAEDLCTSLKIYQLLRKSEIRTKILSIKGASDMCFSRSLGLFLLILLRCSSSDLQEVQMINPAIKNTEPIPMHMITWTRDVRVTAEIQAELSFVQVYVVFDKGAFAMRDAKELRNYPGSPSYKENGQKDLTVNRQDESCIGYHYLRLNTCGAVRHSTIQKIRHLDPGDCEMRWTCAKHSDPFKYWYLQQLIKPQHTDFSEFEAQGPPANLYQETVYPFANGVDPIEELIKWVKERMEKEEKWKEWNMAQEGSEDSEAKKSEGSAMVELKSEVVSGKAEEGSLRSELESKELEVLKTPASGEVQKELKVSDVLESDDSDAENPFNTEEFKAKFNESNSKIDKSWAILMIFAVLSVLFALFFTFF